MAIVVSACLLGENCKYNGGNNYNERLIHLLKGREVIPVCPEVAGGLPIPRYPAEIVDGVVINTQGESVDAAFRLGVEREIDRLAGQNIECAVLQSRSPSCGCREVYDGTFSKTLIPGQGVFARAMTEKGYKVFDIEDFVEDREQIFLAVAAGLRKELGIIPLMFGSLGLGKRLEMDLHPEDVDILVPKTFLDKRWPDLQQCMETQGYVLYDLHEHAFCRDEVSVAFAGIENLESFAGINVAAIPTMKEGYRLLTLEDYLAVYLASAQDGYRQQKKNHADLRKVELIRARLQQKESY